MSKPQSLHGESIAMQGEPGELKHLSSRRKRKKTNKPSDVNAIASERPSKKEHRADALALRADERRDKLR